MMKTLFATNLIRVTCSLLSERTGPLPLAVKDSIQNELRRQRVSGGADGGLESAHVDVTTAAASATASPLQRLHQRHRGDEQPVG